MKIVFAEEIGLCFGASRAIKMAKENLARLKKPIKMHGSLVHNEAVAKHLSDLGIQTIDELGDAKKGTLMITAHGLSPKIKLRLKKNKELEILDTTCPLVTAAQEKSRILHDEGRIVLIYGDSEHREVLGIKGAADDQAIIFSSKEELLKIRPEKTKKYGLISQTTQEIEKFEEIVYLAKKQFSDLKILKTICQTTARRQAAIKKLARESDLVLVIGSRSSSNSRRLYEISLKINPTTYFITDAKNLKKSWFKNVKNVGIGSGASAPSWVIDEVVKKIKSYDQKT